MRLAIAIPAFNEERSIATVVRQVRRFGHVIVASDGSTDGTDAVARNAGAEVLRLSVNGGYDAALSAALLHAWRTNWEAVITCDADGQHDPSAIPRLVAPLTRGAWVTIGIRDSRPRFGESLFCIATSLRWGIRDPMCGMKAYRCQLFRHLAHLGQWKSIGSEATLFAARRRLVIAQVPIPIRDRRDGQPRFGVSWRANARIFNAMVHGFMCRPKYATGKA